MLARSLTPRKLDDLAGRVVEFYDAWGIDAPLLKKPLRAYSGGTFTLKPDRTPEFESLLSSLLYYPAIVVHCPFSAWFNRDLERLHLADYKFSQGELLPEFREFRLEYTHFTEPTDIASARERLALSLAPIHAFRRLIEQGWIIPVPAWRIVADRQEQIATAMRHDLRDEEFFHAVAPDNPFGPPRVRDILHAQLRFQGVRSASTARRIVVEPPSFFLNKLLVIADTTGAVYVPPEEQDYRLLQLRADRLQRELRQSRIDFDVVSNVLQLDLPMFRQPSIETIAEIREGEEAFFEFRDVLSSAFRTASSNSSSGDRIEDLREGARAALEPRVAEVRRAASRSKALGSLVDGATTIGIDGVSMAAQAFSGAALSVPSVAAGLAAGGVTAALFRMLRRSPHEGANLVIAKMLQSRRDR